MYRRSIVSTGVGKITGVGNIYNITEANNKYGIRNIGQLRSFICIQEAHTTREEQPDEEPTIHAEQIVEE